MTTEDELARALRQLAEAAPETDLLAGVRERRRRRTRRRAQAVAVAAVIAVAGTSTTVTRGGVLATGGGHDAAATASAVEEPRAANPADTPARPVDEVWPQAVFTMPARNADGWKYRPITGISATEVLLSAEPSFEKAGALEVYDTVTRKARVVTRMPSTPGLKEYIHQTATTDGKSVAWFAYGERQDGSMVREIWTVPLSGGEPRLLVTLTGERARIATIALAGEHVVWSDERAVWRLPLAGGEETKLADRLHVIAWPWAGDLAEGPGTADANQTRVVNLETGEIRRIAAAPGAEGLRCGVTWCSGRQRHAGLVQRVDGSGQAAFREAMTPPDAYPVLDRFVRGRGEVYDTATGVSARVDNPGTWSGVGVSAEPSTILYWGTTRSGKPHEYRVLNLAAVPAAQ
ncbi:TolB family protein [Nonomuraea indica]|uniref:TolB family protein n=1 Tax=Nonomuraea indica TaxID=1581193 RepID=A0ABW7ZVX1_9ACTN